MTHAQQAMSQTVTISSTPTLSQYGKPSFGTSKLVKGRFTLKASRVIGRKGEVVGTEAVFHTYDTIAALDVGDKLTYEGKDYRIVGLKQPRTMAGKIDHTKCWLSRWEG